jgi:hypothetical protein
MRVPVVDETAQQESVLLGEPYVGDAEPCVDGELVDSASRQDQESQAIVTPSPPSPGLPARK